MSFGRAVMELLSAAAEELFREYAVEAHPVDACADGAAELGGILGFRGDTFAGCVIVTAGRATFEATNPTPLATPESWCGELTNQIMGRFRTALYARGVDVDMSIPVVLSATRLSPQPRHAMTPVCLALASGPVAIWLEYEGEPALTVPDVVEPIADALMF